MSNPTNNGKMDMFILSVCQLRDDDACQNMSVTRKPLRNDILY